LSISLNTQRGYKNQEVTAFQYDCAQSEHNHRTHEKHEDLKKHWDRCTMAHFSCQGSLKVVVGEEKVVIQFWHMLPHVPYVSIDIPPEVQEMIENAVETKKVPTQVSLINL
jgi:hypothetical protein